MKILIVDDETSAREVLTSLLIQLFSEKNKPLQLFEAACLTEAVNTIKDKAPDLVLLDIEMPRHSGLEILDFLKEDPISFQLVFVTAYNNYALEAFRLNAMDYLLKPTDKIELERVIEKVETKSFGSLRSKLDQLQHTLTSLKSSKIVLEVPNGLMFVSPDDIIALAADGMYTKVYLKDGTVTLIAKVLKHFTDQLKPYPFFYRPHRSYGINLRYLKEFKKKEGYSILLENGMSIPLSRDKKEEFLARVKQIF